MVYQRVPKHSCSIGSQTKWPFLSFLFDTPCKVHRLHTCSVRSCRCQQQSHHFANSKYVNIPTYTHHYPPWPTHPWWLWGWPPWPAGLALAGSAGAVAGTILGGAASVQWGVRRGDFRRVGLEKHQSELCLLILPLWLWLTVRHGKSPCY